MAKHNVEGKRIEVLEYIIEYKEDNDGNAPSATEILENTSLTSTHHVYDYLGLLESLGYIKRKQGNRRYIQVVGGHWYPPVRV